MAAPIYFKDSTNPEGLFEYDIQTKQFRYRAPNQQDFLLIKDPQAVEMANKQLLDYAATMQAKSTPTTTSITNPDEIAILGGQTNTLPPTEAEMARAQQDFDKFAQRRDLTRNLGPAALIGGIGAAAQLGQAIAPRTLGNIQDRYAAEELDRLQALERRGQLGLTEGERAEMERQMMNPVRTMARDIQRAGEAERASSGVVTSAASQVRADRERQRLIADQARQAGAQIAAADMAKADQQMRKMEQLIAYKGQRSQQAIANLQKTGMDIAYLAGLARAGKAMEQIDPSGLMSVAPDADSAVRLSKQLTRAQDFGGISQREIEQIAKRNNIEDPKALEFLVNNYATQTQKTSLGDTIKQGRMTEIEQIESNVSKMTPGEQPSGQLSTSKADELASALSEPEDLVTQSAEEEERRRKLAVQFGSADVQRDLEKTIEDKLLKQNLSYDDLSVRELDYLVANSVFEESIRRRQARGQ